MPQTESLQNEQRNSTTYIDEQDEYSENEDSDGNSKICYFDFLPAEVIDIIFSSLVKGNGEYDGNLRLVCKSWYVRCSRNQTMRFSCITEIKRAAKYIGSCAHEKVHLEFNNGKNEIDEIDVIHLLPENVWENFGPKLQLLRFSFCRLGDRLMKSVILNCNNLKHLSVDLDIRGYYDETRIFCSSQTLKVLNVVRPNLESFSIHMGSIPDGYSRSDIRVDDQKWSPIFANLIRIFPNIIHFAISRGDSREFTIEFSKLLEEMDESSLSLCITYLLSDDELKWEESIDKLAKLSLTAVSLKLDLARFIRNRSALLNFFANQKTLKSVGFYLTNCLLGSETDQEMITFTDPSKYDNFQIGCINVQSRSLSYNNIDSSVCPSNFYTYPADWLQKYSYILHMTLTVCVMDEFLQRIFQHMTGLKSLSMWLCNMNSCYALSGRHDQPEVNSEPGYSINRLQDLERLDVQFVFVSWGYEEEYIQNSMDWELEEKKRRDLNKTLFEEFDFPKLRCLCCYLPQGSSTHIDMASKVPLLTKVQFDEDEWENITLEPDLIEFVQQTKNLHTLRLPGEKIDRSEVKKIFDACPALRFLHTEEHIDYYDPLTWEVRRVSR